MGHREDAAALLADVKTRGRSLHTLVAAVAHGVLAVELAVRETAYVPPLEPPVKSIPQPPKAILRDDLERAAENRGVQAAMHVVGEMLGVSLTIRGDEAGTWFDYGQGRSFSWEHDIEPAIDRRLHRKPPTAPSQKGPTRP